MPYIKAQDYREMQNKIALYEADDKIWKSFLHEAAELARERNMPLMVFNTNKKCPQSKDMNATTLQDEDVIRLLMFNIVTAKVLASQNQTTPAFLFFTSGWKRIHGFHGFHDKESFMEQVNIAIEKYDKVWRE